MIRYSLSGDTPLRIRRKGGVRSPHAVCIARLEKAGVLKRGTRKLARKGKREEKIMNSLLKMLESQRDPINPQDLHIEKSKGEGKVTVTHIPTGLSVTASGEQARNNNVDDMVKALDNKVPGDSGCSSLAGR